MDFGAHDAERDGGAVNELVERVERELAALGITHPTARANAAIGLCLKHVWLTAQEERVARAAAQGATC